MNQKDGGGASRDFSVCQHKAGPTTVEAVQALMTAVCFLLASWRERERERNLQLQCFYGKSLV